MLLERNHKIRDILMIKKNERQDLIQKIKFRKILYQTFDHSLLISFL